tara:strand:+ start:267 stop:659 length:393 start_codon:yes stop_codon:yes gene_type:complete
MSALTKAELENELNVSRKANAELASQFQKMQQQMEMMMNQQTTTTAAPTTATLPCPNPSLIEVLSHGASKYYASRAFGDKETVIIEAGVAKGAEFIHQAMLLTNLNGFTKCTPNEVVNYVRTGRGVFKKI